MNALQAVVLGGDGNDTVNVATSQTGVFGGAGANRINIGANGSQTTIQLDRAGLADVYGFKLRNGNKLDLSAVLADVGLDLRRDLTRLGTYVKVSTSGTDATLSFDPDGPASEAGSALAVLHGVGANTTLATLINNDAIRIG